MATDFNGILKLRSPFAESLGIQVTNLEVGNCVCSLELKEHFLNVHKAAHGGVIYSLADIGMGVAVYSALEKDERSMTVEIKINYLKPAYSGPLLCCAKIIQKGKSLAVLEAEIKSADAMIAKAVGTFSIFKSQSETKSNKDNNG